MKENKDWPFRGLRSKTGIIDDAKRPNLRVVFTDELSSEDWDFLENVGLPHGIILIGADFNHDNNQIECEFQEGEEK